MLLLLVIRVCLSAIWKGKKKFLSILQHAHKMKYGALRSAELFHFTVLDGLEIYVCMKGYIVLACKVSLSFFTGLGWLVNPIDQAPR